MKNTTLPSDEWNNVTTSSPKDVILNVYPVYDLALKVIYSILGIVGVIDNALVVIVFIFFIKIADKVLVRTHFISHKWRRVNREKKFIQYQRRVGLQTHVTHNSLMYSLNSQYLQRTYHKLEFQHMLELDEMGIFPDLLNWEVTLDKVEYSRQHYLIFRAFIKSVIDSLIKSDLGCHVRGSILCLPCAYFVWPCLEVNPHDKA